MAKAKQTENMNKATGEVVDAQTEQNSALVVSAEAETFDAMAAISKDILAKAAKAKAAKEEDFRDTESDFWKPETVGEELRGVYLATKPGAKYKVHFFAVIDDSTGKPVAVRVNGSTVLTRELAKVEPGQGVVIRYEGEGKTDAGNKLSKFLVRVLKD